MNSQQALMKSLMHEEVGALRTLTQDREKDVECNFNFTVG